MKLRKADVAFVVAVVAVVVGVSLLPSPREQNPRIPSTADHEGVKAESDCLQCHGPGRPQALPIPPHPKRTDCYHCHARAAPT